MCHFSSHWPTTCKMQQQSICLSISFSAFSVCTQQCSPFILLCLLFPSSPFNWATYNFYQVIKFSWNFFSLCSIVSKEFYWCTIGAWRINSLISIGIFVLFVAICSNHLCRRCEQSIAWKELTPIQWDMQLLIFFRIGLMIEILSLSFLLHSKSFNLNNNLSIVRLWAIQSFKWIIKYHETIIMTVRWMRPDNT